MSIVFGFIIYVKSQIICKSVSSWCCSPDYSTRPSVKVAVAPFFTVSTSNPVLCNKPPPHGPPSHTPTSQPCPFKSVLSSSQGLYPWWRGIRRLRTTFKRAPSFKVTLQKRLGLEMRNSLAIIFFYSCFAIFTSAKWSLSEKRLYPGFNFPSVNPLTLKSPPCLCSELLTLT